MAMLENVFSWSKSRDEQFRECQHKYFYDKYASWGGWDRSAPPPARMAYILKNLKNRWAWKGETVHHEIENVLKEMRAGRETPLETSLARLTDTMRANYRSSKAKKYMEDPKRSPGLFEHEYEKPVTDAVWKEFHDSSAACLRAFYNSSLYQELKSDDKSEWLAIEDLEDFKFDGAKVYVKLDFARRKNGLVEIYDWKTGKDDSAAASVQMGTYALYAMQKWHVPLESIRAYLFNLGTPSPVASPQTLNEPLLVETKKTMLESIAGMRALLADPAKNIPRPLKDFGYIENVRFCDFCNFRKICDRFEN